MVFHFISTYGESTITPLYRWENWGLEELCTLLKATRLFARELEFDSRSLGI